MVPIAGIAFAGDRGISKVEVSTDGGNTWMPASVQDPLSDYTWVFWTADWNPPAAGRYSIAVRATDGTGAVQTAAMTPPFPAGRRATTSSTCASRLAELQRDLC